MVEQGGGGAHQVLESPHQKSENVLLSVYAMILGLRAYWSRVPVYLINKPFLPEKYKLQV